MNTKNIALAWFVVAIVFAALVFGATAIVLNYQDNLAPPAEAATTQPAPQDACTTIATSGMYALLTRCIDSEARVVCYVSKQSGGLDCLPIRDTTLSSE